MSSGTKTQPARKINETGILVYKTAGYGSIGRWSGKFLDTLSGCRTIRQYAGGDAKTVGGNDVSTRRDTRKVPGTFKE